MSIVDDGQSVQVAVGVRHLRCPLAHAAPAVVGNSNDAVERGKELPHGLRAGDPRVCLGKDEVSTLSHARPHPHGKGLLRECERNFDSLRVCHHGRVGECTRDLTSFDPVRAQHRRSYIAASRRDTDQSYSNYTPPTHRDLQLEWIESRLVKPADEVGGTYGATNREASGLLLR